jgi:hypothetical protein
MHGYNNPGDYVRCGADGPYFTRDKYYQVVEVKGLLHIVRDDDNNQRYIIPNEVCPHLYALKPYSKDVKERMFVKVNIIKL